MLLACAASHSECTNATTSVMTPGIGGRQHAVAQVEHVARRARVDRAASVLDDGARRPLDHRPSRQQHHRIEVALQRGAGRHPDGGIGQRRAPVDADHRLAARATASDIAPSSSAVPTPKCVIGTPASASAANTRALCGST